MAVPVLSLKCPCQLAKPRSNDGRPVGPPTEGGGSSNRRISRHVLNERNFSARVQRHIPSSARDVLKGFLHHSGSEPSGRSPGFLQDKSAALLDRCCVRALAPGTSAFRDVTTVCAGLSRHLVIVMRGTASAGTGLARAASHPAAAFLQPATPRGATCRTRCEQALVCGRCHAGARRRGRVPARGPGRPPRTSPTTGTPGNRKWEINLACTPLILDDESTTRLPDLDANFGAGDRIELNFEIAWLRAAAQPDMAKYGLGQGTVGVKWRF
jgi:hypothetical protein